MDWPPDEQGWAGILKELPQGGDCAAVRAAVEAAVQEFITIPGRPKPSRERELWLALGRMAAGKNLTNFRKRLEQTAALTDSSNPERDRLLLLADELAKLTVRARGWAEFHRRRSRRERFDSALLLAWTGPGKGKLAASAKGPLQRFYNAITDEIIHPVLGEDVKKIVNREKRRWQLLASTSVTFEGEGGLKASVGVFREGQFVEEIT